MEKSTKCKSCKREVPANATFCPWCGKRQVKEKKADGAIKVPEPKKLPSGNWTIYLRAEKQSITESTKEKCITKAKAVRAGFIENRKKRLPLHGQKPSTCLYRIVPNLYPRKLYEDTALFSVIGSSPS